MATVLLNTKFKIVTSPVISITIKINQLMNTIRITKEFSFEMAHALKNYDGPCVNIHGHSYRLFVTLIGQANTNIDSPKYGMLMDFGELKKLVHKEIIEKYDHALVIAESDTRLPDLQKISINILTTPYQPTCENLVVDIAQQIGKQLPNHITIHSIKLYETATSFAEWYASDN